MATVYPFRGVRYDPEKAGPLAELVAPPYDVISNEARDGYYQINQFNVIRLILGKTYPDDTTANNRYTRARDFLNQWIKLGALRRDDRPALYFYQQDYNLFGRPCSRKGIIGLIKLEDFDSEIVLPHEETFSKPKEDRFNLLKESQANFSPIFTFYEDDHTVEDILADYLSQNPLVDIEDQEGVRHKLWVIDEPGDIEKISSYLKDKSILIADGHHRYETALNFRDLMRREKGNRSNKESFNRTMVYLVDINQGFNVLPAHRLVRGLGEGALSAIEQFFNIFPAEKENILTRMQAGELPHSFGMYYQGECRVLSLKDVPLPERLVNDKHLLGWKKLDVGILHKLLLEYLLNVGEGNIAYQRDKDVAIRLVDSGEYEAVFFLNPIGKEEFKSAAKARYLLPKKSTYFYPKPLSGLVINKMEEEDGKG